MLQTEISERGHKNISLIFLDLMFQNWNSVGKRYAFIKEAARRHGDLKRFLKVFITAD